MKPERAAWQEQQLQEETGLLLGQLESQGLEAVAAQQHAAQAAELTAALESTTDALEHSQADLRQAAAALESTRQQLAQVSPRLCLKC